ncbi:MAG: 4,5-DOPA dioxygenase extradiol [Bacteroidia bacterium]|nr:4,5-DOPA dioxygenase extradiol [Bacteroidia bacterium]
MTRKDFLQLGLAGGGAAALGTLEVLARTLDNSDTVMPAYFIGHGSPMNAIEDNRHSEEWKHIKTGTEAPRMILCVSAHWLTRGTYITSNVTPPTIHDFGGFPQALFDVQYPAPGSPELAKEVASEIYSVQAQLTEDWGLDHGTWSVLKHIRPQADIPVLQLSIDYKEPASFHYALGRELAKLRRKGVLIIGSGNMVHNLRMVAWDHTAEQDYGYDWALQMNETFNEKLLNRDFDALVNYQQWGEAARNAIPTPDHYYPMLYTLGLVEKDDELALFNNSVIMGSLSMTSFSLTQKF